MAWLDGHSNDGPTYGGQSYDSWIREPKSNWPASAMATIPNKAASDVSMQPEKQVTSWPLLGHSCAMASGSPGADPVGTTSFQRFDVTPEASGRDALQALIAFSALHQQVRQRRALASQFKGFETIAQLAEFEAGESFVLDEVLQMVAHRAIVITGADGLGIALAENNEIVLRASAGTIKPDVGARIERDSAFSGACFRSAQIIRCDDTETDDRVNLYACRQLGARSIVAVPLCGRRRVIGLLEAFSSEPFGFNDSDIRSLELLAALILGALKPEDEDRFAQAAEIAETTFVSPPESTRAAQFHEKQAIPPALTEIELPQATAETAEDNYAEAGSLLDDAASSEDIAEPETGEPEIGEPEMVAPDIIAPEIAAPGSTRHPGIIVVLVLVVVCALVGGGIWWKLNNAQLSTVMVRPEQKMTGRPAKLPGLQDIAPAAGDATLNRHESLAGTSASDADLDGPAAAPAEAASPQALSKMARVTGIRHWSSSDSSTVVLDLEDQVQYEAHRLVNPDRIYFDLHDTALTAELVGKTIEIGDPSLTRVRVAQPNPGLTRVVLETKGNAIFSVSLETNPYRLMVQVRKPGTDPKAQINLFPGAGEAERAKMAIVVPPPTHEDLQLRARVPKMRIVVDAGHGGWDLGTVGKHGLLEKDVVLEIAQRLGKLLESRLGSTVILTRNDDNYIPLDERAGMANQAQADLFVSVHANYSDLPSARGVETYYTNFFSSPSAKEMETRAAGNKSPVTATLSPADLHERIEQSRRLAASVQRSLYGTLSSQNSGLRDRGVKEASYVVLTETAMPGILAEVSFVSSPADEQKLRSDGYREQIAEALYKGIARYAATSRGVKVASAAK
jgi:N-acetylmuramoyl-L-alanine amidase/GAF domain-containing protein